MLVSHATQEALPPAAGIGYLAFIASLPPEVVMGAFAGSVIFLLGSKNKTTMQWLVLFLLAFLTGIIGSTLVAEICGGLLGLIRITVSVPHGIGAIVAAACTINIVSLFRDNPAFFFSRFFQKKEDGDTPL